MKMKITSFWALALLRRVIAQTTTVSVGTCADWPSTISADTVLELAAKEIACPTNTYVEVVNGAAVTMTSAFASTTLDNVRFEVVDSSKLILDVPDLTMTGIYQSQVGGVLFVDVGSTMEVMHEITFSGNSIFLKYGIGFDVVSRGGAAVYSAGTTTFYERAYFLGNGQYEADGDGEEPDNEAGGALFNSGSMTFMKKATFMDNFNPNGGNGGAIANLGNLAFQRRGVFRNNSVGPAFNDDGIPYGGLGGAVYNGGEDSTILFALDAFFQDNVGGTAGGALASEGEGTITFEGKAKFKDNYILPRTRPTSSSEFVVEENMGGGALAAIGATSVDFGNTAVFKWNEAVKGGAILNSGSISFVSEEKLVTADNVASFACADILNNDAGIITIGTTTAVGGSDSLCERAAA